MENCSIEKKTCIQIKMKNINSYLSCQLCDGYLIDAVTICECLHSFCKTCLLRHLDCNYHCPTCNVIIHPSHPLSHIRNDRVLQSIVYKLLPELYIKELKQRSKFYRDRGLLFSSSEELSSTTVFSKPINIIDTDDDHETSNSNNSPIQTTHQQQQQQQDEEAEEDCCDLKMKYSLDYYLHLPNQVNVSLEAEHGGLPLLHHGYLRLSAMATIAIVKKFIALKLLNDMDKFNQVVICLTDNGKRQVLFKDHSLQFVIIMFTKGDDSSLLLQYSFDVENGMKSDL